MITDDRAAYVAGGLDDYERSFLLACCGVKRFAIPTGAREQAVATFERFRRMGLIERDPKADAAEGKHSIEDRGEATE